MLSSIALQTRAVYRAFFIRSVILPKLVDVPQSRIRLLNTAAISPAGDYVLYWMVANRRLEWNFSLQRAAACAERLNKPLVICEPLRVGYRWASDRLHRFVMQGMADNLQQAASLPVHYYAYVEPQHLHGHGLFEACAAKACVVITDDFPCFFLPVLLKWMGRNSPVLVEAIDSNGLLPMRAADHDYPTAYAFRRFLQKTLPQHLNQLPVSKPLETNTLSTGSGLSDEILSRWPMADAELLQGEVTKLAAFPIDHSVGPAPINGGRNSAGVCLKLFLKHRLDRYGEHRNDPDQSAASGLSPYLHFGHVSTHEIFSKIVKCEEWSPEELSSRTSGQREGWWGMSPSAESFLDELITWRELGYNMCVFRRDYDRYGSLPTWAQTTLAEHASDAREVLYTLEQLENSETYDSLWNAAQRQLVQDGTMHNYLRMLWGKKILQWTESPQQALEFMIELNNKYALDGRNPNSYSGIFWVLGRYDRAWGPERPVFGKIRYMTSDSTLKKLKLQNYLKKYATDPGGDDETPFRLRGSR